MSVTCELRRDFYFRPIIITKMFVLLILALALLPAHLADFNKIDSYTIRATNDTMFPVLCALNVVTAVSTSAQFGLPYSAAVFGSSGSGLTRNLAVRGLSL